MPRSSAELGLLQDQVLCKLGQPARDVLYHDETAVSVIIVPHLLESVSKAIEEQLSYFVISAQHTLQGATTIEKLERVFRTQDLEILPLCCLAFRELKIVLEN